MMMDRISPEQKLSSQEIDRLFEKQVSHEAAMEEEVKRQYEERLRARWIMDRRGPREFPNDALAKEKRQTQERVDAVANAKQEARSIQVFLERRRRDERMAILKEGVLEGVVEIHETPTGFAIDTPREKVLDYLWRHPKLMSQLPIPEELRDGWFLLGAVADSEKERVSYVRKSLVEEFHAKSPSDFMLVDLATSNYVRAMYATTLEMESLRYADDYRMQMFEVMMEGVQAYIHACQNQLLRVLSALQSKRHSFPSSTFTQETYSRTDINLENWGLALLLSLAEITEGKEQEIGIDEIKLAMTRYVKGVSAETIPNAWIGYALRRFGFTAKVHASEGNRYNIDRDHVLTLLNEDLKP